MAKLVFLGRLEDVAGTADCETAAGSTMDWAALVTWIGDSYGAELAQTIQGERVKVALNGALIGDKAALVIGAADELAFLPPVSGG